jgi:hypothetical protein
MTLESQYKQFLKHNPDSTFSFKEWKQWHGNEIKQALTDMQNKYKDCKATDFYDEQDPRGMSTSEYDAYMKAKKEQKQHIVDLMKADEELGLYDEPVQRLEKYSERFDNKNNQIVEGVFNPETWGKRLVEDNNHYIEPFLLRNGFKKQKNNSYDNLKCIITVLDGCYQIDWNHIKYGEISTYTDSYSILHLVGILTWNGLIDRNYKK